MSAKNYAIFRIKKHSQGSRVSFLLNHHLRTSIVQNADPELSNKNRVLIKVDDPKSFINDIPAGTKKNACKFVDMLFTASEFTSKKHLAEWTDRTLDFVNKTFGKENIALAVLHQDETTPHMHVIFKPVNPKTKKLGAGFWFDGRDKMSKLQDEYHSQVKHLGFDRGERNSRAKHTTIKQFYSKVNQAESEHKDFTKQLANEAKKFENLSLWQKAKYIKSNGIKPTLGKIVKQTKPTFLLASMSNPRHIKKLKEKAEEAKQLQETTKRQEEQLKALTGSKFPSSSEINKIIDLKKKQDLEEQQEREARLNKQNEQQQQKAPEYKRRKGYGFN